METPYNYQIEASRILFTEGRDLILQAPTGAGKTRAALRPGTMGLSQNLQMPGAALHPPRILYGVPMRVLATDFVGVYRGIARGERGYARWEYEWQPTIQTGESPEDPQLEGRVIFATVDQLLASFLNLPYGLPRRLGNINAGALIGSYLIFDEFHLYPRDQMMLSVLALLKMLKGISRFTLMTATFSEPLLRGIAEILSAQLIANAPGRFGDVPSLSTQERTWQAHEGRLHAAFAAELIGDASRALVLCNTVDRAQALYRDLQAAMPDHDVMLLHSRFYRKDRRRIEDLVRSRLGKDSDLSSFERPFVLVATQVVEVGLDISSEVLISECAPAASLIQRAGRCARRAHEKGRVHIFQPFDETGEVNYAPYFDEGQEHICRLTWEALNQSQFNGQVLRFTEEQALIDAAHGEADEAFVAMLQDGIRRRIGEITKCMATPDAGRLGSLIRKNMNVPLYVSAAPNTDDLLTSKPWQREAFSLSKKQIARLMEQGQAADAEFVVAGGREEREEDPDSAFARSVFVWDPLKDASEANGSRYRMFTAHPEAIGYSPEIGLELHPGEYRVDDSPVTAEAAWIRLQYQAERYHEHIQGLYLAYTQPAQLGQAYRTGLRDEFLYPLARLCERIGLDPQQGEALMRLTLALHDLGKLNRRWQAWSRAWQELRRSSGYVVGLPLDDPAPLAHTDYDSGNAAERELQRSLKHRPRGNHAVEGAQAALEILRAATDDHELWLAVSLGAIMRHHTPDADSCKDFALTPGSAETVQQALTLCGFEQQAQGWAAQIPERFVRSSQDVEQAPDLTLPALNEFRKALLYLLFVRILRLTDQRSSHYLYLYGERG